MTIEERAKEYANNREGVTNPSVLCYMAEAYEDGATEQKKIDIEKACEWLRKQYPPYMEYDAILDAMLDNFKKAMEE